MPSDITFYTHPFSRGRIVRWMLEEIGQPYDTEVVDFADMKTPSYLAINPMGKVPAIRHRGTVVTEAAAICAYLADAYPQAGLALAVGSALRGPYYRWMFFGAGPIEQATSIQAFGWQEPPERRGMIGCGSMADVMNALEGVLKTNEYLAGSNFTAADLYVGAQLGWGMMAGTIEKRPVFEIYVGRLRSRPAAKRANDIDDELAAKLRGNTEPAN
jgi:glutathione S-transferase